MPPSTLVNPRHKLDEIKTLDWIYLIVSHIPSKGDPSQIGQSNPFELYKASTSSSSEKYKVLVGVIIDKFSRPLQGARFPSDVE